MSEKSYIDNNGYRRFNDSKTLVHRWVAYNQVYKKNKEKYDRPFSDYQIHHKDGNKTNNDPDNLELITNFQHNIKHNKFDSEEWLIIKSLGIIICGVVLMFLYILVLIENKSSLNFITSLPFFVIMIIMYLLVSWIMKKSKENK